METWLIVVIIGVALLILIGIIVTYFVLRSSKAPSPSITPQFAPLVPGPPSPLPPAQTVPRLEGRIMIDTSNQPLLSLSASFSTPTTSASASINKSGRILQPSSVEPISPIDGVSGWRAKFTAPDGFLENNATYILGFQGTNAGTTGPFYTQTYVYRDDPDVGPEVVGVVFGSDDGINAIVSFESPATSVAATLTFNGTTLQPSRRLGGGTLWNIFFNTPAVSGTTYSFNVRGTYENRVGPDFTTTFQP